MPSQLKKPKARGEKRKIKPAPKAATAPPRARRAAALAAAGAKPGRVAAELGVSRTTAWRILRSEEVQQLAITLVNSHLPVISSLFEDGLTAVREALRADRPDTITKDGACFGGGPDHYARLAAVTRLLQLLTAGRPKPKPPEESERKGMTLAEIESHIRGQSVPTERVDDRAS